MGELENFKKNELSEVPQMNHKSGLSNDYRNEYAAFKTIFDIGGIREFKEFLGDDELHIKKYEERFSPTIYNTITDKNKESVKKINELAEKMNNIIQNPEGFSDDDFLKIYNELETIFPITRE